MMSRKLMAPLHHHSSQTENLKPRRLSSLWGQHEHFSVCDEFEFCVCVRTFLNAWGEVDRALE